MNWVLWIICGFPVGSFGEVFRGIWRGTEVAIKVMLEQDLTTENMQDFCNEISLLRYIWLEYRISVTLLWHCQLPFLVVLSILSSASSSFFLSFCLFQFLIRICVVFLCFAVGSAILMVLLQPIICQHQHGHLLLVFVLAKSVRFFVVGTWIAKFHLLR